jgi:hypothetical protein
MGWKYRNGRAYYYKSERQGGRGTSTYFTEGAPAQLGMAGALPAGSRRGRRAAPLSLDRLGRDARLRLLHDAFRLTLAPPPSALVAAGRSRVRFELYQQVRRLSLDFCKTPHAFGLRRAARSLAHHLPTVQRPNRWTVT